MGWEIARRGVFGGVRLGGRPPPERKKGFLYKKKDMTLMYGICCKTDLFNFTFKMCGEFYLVLFGGLVRHLGDAQGEVEASLNKVDEAVL